MIRPTNLLKRNWKSVELWWQVPLKYKSIIHYVIKQSKYIREINMQKEKQKILLFIDIILSKRKNSLLVYKLIFREEKEVRQQVRKKNSQVYILVVPIFFF